MPDLALWDVLAPYWLLGNAAGNAHAAFAVLAVDQYEQATDGTATVIRGRARFYGDVDAYLDPSTLSFGVNAANTEGHPKDDPSRRDAWIDLRDTTVDFQLVAPRTGSPVVAAGHTPIDNPAPGDAFAPVDAVLDALDTLPIDQPTSDYPSTDFVLDLVFTTAVLRPPFLSPAKMRADGLLEPDPEHPWVALTLPKIKVRVDQNASTGNQPRLRLQSFGATGLDDGGDIGVAQLVTMDPPYAFIGPGRTIGFGFRSAVLDLSDGTTPMDVLDQFGFDQSWTGIYLPEIRLFVAPQGADGFAVNAGARNLLIGIGDHAGITGDFELDVINQGDGPLEIAARFSAPDGRTIGPRMTSGGTGTVTLPENTTMAVDVGGRRPPYTVEISLDGGATFQPDRVATIDLSSTTSMTIVIRATTPDDPTPAEVTITARRQDTSGGAGATPPPPSVPPARVSVSSTTRDGQPVSGPDVVIASQTNTSVTLRLTDRSVAAWTVGGAPVGGGAVAEVTIPLAPGATAQVVATGANTSTSAPVFFHFDEPDQMTVAQLDGWASTASNTRTEQSVNSPTTTQWTGGTHVLASSEYDEALGSLTPGDSIVVVGHASFDGDDAKAAYNLSLSERRATIARSLYARMAPSGVTITLEPRGFQTAKPAQQADPEGNPRSLWWRAELKNAIVVAGPVTTATVERAATGSPPNVPAVIDPPPPEPERPDFLRSIGAKVRIIRDDFIAVEIHGEVDFDTAAEAMLREQNVPAGELPTFEGLGHQNPGDGIVQFRGVFTRDPGSDEWALTVLFGSHPSDVDGLMMTGSLPGQPLAPRTLGRNLLGLYALFYPLLADVSPEQPGTAEISDIAVTGAAAALPAVLAATDWFIVERVVWYGGEVRVRQRDGGWSTTLLFDVETAVSAQIALGGQDLITVSREVPVVARYKAIGVRFGADVTGEPIFHPVFDSSRGYTLDLARPGSLSVAQPLDRLLKVLGARVSRTNPTFLELELGASVDLGVVALDRAGVRIRLADPVEVELTALGVSVAVPGVLEGSGYLAFDETGFRGRVDVSLVPLRLRIAARLRIDEITEGDRTATGVAIGLEVEFPVGIPLWSSGLGIYGFLGLFAMHYTRNEELDAASTTKALSWLKRAGGDPTRVDEPSLWKPDLDHWAFGVGAIVGTMGSPIVFNMKGMVLVELPGPRLMLMMKANVIMPMPDLEGDGEGTILAVVDLDVGRGTITIGLTIDYTVNPLITIRIPVEAFFDGNDPTNWHLYLGKHADPVRAEVLFAFSGRGYLMLLGDGSRTPSDLSPALPRPAGFTIATGLQVSMIWGVKPAGLYAELSAGFDAVLGFSPILVAGTITVRGDLRLFIVWLSAHAKLDVRLGELPGSDPVDSGYEIHGEVCGELDLFFFSVKGCVDFTLKDNAPPDLAIPPLLDGVSLIARSPALVHGTGTDEPIDGAIGHAVASAAAPGWGSLPADPADDTPEQAAIRAATNVPINAMPVVMFAAPPMANGVTFEGEALGGSSGGREVIRSTDQVTYTLTSVELVGDLLDTRTITLLGVEVVIDLGTPATWWTLQPPTDANESVQLALLSWVPNATPKALQASEQLDEWVTDRWGTVCHRAAPPAPVLWTFRHEPVGPSANGWEVDGEPWPDPPDTVRSVAPDTRMRTHEVWRCGHPIIDDYRGILPAHVTGAIVGCPKGEAPGGLVANVGAVATNVAPLRRGTRTLSAGSVAAGAKTTEVLSEPTLATPELLRRLRHSEPVPRSSLTAVAGSAERAARISARLGTGEVTTCESRVLAAPRFDTLRPPEDPALAGDVAAAWEVLGFDPGDLHDAVVLGWDCGDTVRLLLFVDRRLLIAEEVLVRCLDAAGAVLDERSVTEADIVTVATLPAPWTDPDGPWDDDIALVVQHFQVLQEITDNLQMVLVEAAPGELSEVVVGCRTGVFDRTLPIPPFYVAAVEALTCSEISRHDSDSQTQQADRSVLEAALGNESAFVALMKPDTQYEIRVGWSATGQNDAGATAAVPDHTESFWFRTAAESPGRLDPFVLCTTPYEAQRHVFGGDPMQLTFATNDLIDLYDAYGERLEVHINAASARHPDPADAGLPHPFPIDASTTVPVAAAVLSPWEHSVLGVIDAECVEVDEERSRHSKTTIPIPLHPATDYLLDVHRVPKAAPPGAAGDRVFRRSFTTSQFATLGDYAGFIIGTAIRHRAVPTGLAAAVLGQFGSRHPEGAELDAVLRGSGGQPGIEPMGVPEKPSVIVWWETGGATPQPVAVVIDGIEPFWHDRDRPRLETVPNTDMKQWELRREAWIEPVIAGGSDPIIQRVVKAPGGQRAIVLLTAASRGKRLRLDLVKHAFTEPHLDGPTAVDERHLVVDVTLDRAPWEEN